MGFLDSHSDRLTVARYEKAKALLVPTGSFLYAARDSYLKKTSAHIIAVSTQPKTSLTIYSMAESKASVQGLDSQVSAQL